MVDKGMEKIREEQWLNSVLQNDDTSTDRELIDYFTNNGLSKEAAELVVSQRSKALNDLSYKVITRKRATMIEVLTKKDKTSKLITLHDFLNNLPFSKEAATHILADMIEGRFYTDGEVTYKFYDYVPEITVG